MRAVFMLWLLTLVGSAHALEHVSLQLKWRHQFQFAGYYAALEQGYYKQAGLHVTLLEAGTDTNVVDEVVSGRAQYGVGTSELLLASQHAPVVALAVIFQHSPLILLARSDRVGNLHELADRRVMVEAHSEELLAYLRKERLPPHRLDIQPHSQRIQDLIDGSVDAMSAYSTTEPYLLRRAGVASIEFSPRAGGIDFYGDNLFTSQQELQDHPERVRAFREASLRGWAYAMQHPQEIVALILARYNTQQLEHDMLLFEADRTRQLMQPDLVEVGYMHPGRWQHIADTYAELDMHARGSLPTHFLYNPHAPRWPAWLLPTAVGSGLIMLALGMLSLHNLRLRRQLQQQIAAEETAHQQLAKSEAQYRFMLENSADTFWVLDAQLRFTYVSAADERIRGFKASEVLGRCLLEMLTPASAAHVQQEAARRQHIEGSCGQTGPLRFEFEMYCKDGSTVWAESHSAPIRDAQQHIIGFSGVTRDISEHKRLQQEQQAAHARMSAQLQEIQALQARLQEQAIRDGLTGLFNRRYLDEQLPSALAQARQDGHALAFVMLDIDHFKQINDHFGHPAGDQVIQALARLLQTNRREHDMACRWGGEEFVLVLPRTRLADALDSAERWRQQAAGLHVTHGDLVMRFTVSAGVACYPDHGNDAHTLLACADAALYQSKTQGRNRVTGFAEPTTDAMDSPATDAQRPA